VTVEATYVHTNLVARDWRRLAAFYTAVFGCEVRGAERALHGAWLEVLTGLAGARLEGVHLGLPGHGDGGPTLEIFTYAETEESPAAGPNRVGYGHIAFRVDDVPAALRRILDNGGETLGGPVRTTVAGEGELEVAYARDPEGNIVELQRWG
jgi:catechol 2,3-dioxygenase-like lactoylglutathione lyase family enzyme